MPAGPWKTSTKKMRWPIQRAQEYPKLNDQPADTHKTEVSKCEQREPARYLANESSEAASITEGQFGRVVEIISEESGTMPMILMIPRSSLMPGLIPCYL